MLPSVDETVTSIPGAIEWLRDNECEPLQLVRIDMSELPAEIIGPIRAAIDRLVFADVHELPGEIRDAITDLVADVQISELPDAVSDAVDHALARLPLGSFRGMSEDMKDHIADAIEQEADGDPAALCRRIVDTIRSSAHPVTG